MKIIFFVPHLSTGGMPQYVAWLVKELLKTNDKKDIHVVEYSDIAPIYVVQKNRIRDILGDNLITLYGSDEEKCDIIFKKISDIDPDIIHFQELPETFIPSFILDKIYYGERRYKIVETTHTVHSDIHGKKYLPDSFAFISDYIKNQYAEIPIIGGVLDMDIEKNNRPDRDKTLISLGLDPSYKHILNVGLFTPGKNQGEIFEIARSLIGSRIVFHFVGNQAPNFEDYWGPLMKNKPENCVVWGERNDVDIFYSCMDMFLFTSINEANPIVIKEAISWGMKIFMNNLDSYGGKYNNNDKVEFLSRNRDENINKISKYFDQFVEGHEKCSSPIRISVVTRIKNMSRYFDQMYLSLKNQTFKNFELWVMDNNSTDDISEKIKILQKEDANIYYKLLPNFLDYWKNYEFVNGDIVVLLDADDLLSNDALEKIDKCFTEYQDIDFLLNDVALFNDGLFSIESEFRHFYPQEKGFINYTELKIFGHDLSVKGLSYRKSYAGRIFSKHQPKTPIGDDSEALLILDIFGGRYIILHETLLFYRINLCSLIGSKTLEVDDKKVATHYNEIWVDIIDHIYGILNYKHSIRDVADRKKDFYKDMLPFMHVNNILSNNYFEKDSEQIYDLNPQYKLSKLSKNILKESKLNHDLKLVHLLTRPTDDREKRSITSIRLLEKFGFPYKNIVNEPCTEYPEDRKPCHPHDIKKPGYWGNYNAFKNCILKEFDKDFLMICECDCEIEIPHDQFVNLLNVVCDIMIKEDIYYFSFGDIDCSNEVKAIENVSFMHYVNKIIGCHCIIFYKSAKEFLFKSFEREEWDSADLYFNYIFEDKPYKMAALTKDRVCRQSNGYSFIDQKYVTRDRGLPDSDFNEDMIDIRLSRYEGNKLRADMSFNETGCYDGESVCVVCLDIFSNLCLSYFKFICKKGINYWFCPPGDQSSYVDDVCIIVYYGSIPICKKSIFKNGNKNKILMVGDREVKIFSQIVDFHFCTFYEIFIKKIYENDFVKIEKGDICVDIGANIGIFSMYAIGAGASIVYSVEPFPVAFYSLDRNSRYFNNMKTFNVAVSNKTEDKTLKEGFYGGTCINSLYQSGDPVNKQTDNISCFDVNIKIIDINKFIKDNDIKRIDFLKIDTEGSEYDILMGIDEEYLKNKIKKISVECHPHAKYNRNDIIRRLEENGFICHVPGDSSVIPDFSMLFGIKK